MAVKPPSNMHSGPVKLIFEKIVDPEPAGELVPFCHIGYEILPAYRGNSYSYFACNAISLFVGNLRQGHLTSDVQFFLSGNAA
jgi:hypothetical protein